MYTSEQLNDYFERHFNPYLSAFRKGFSCQSVLLAISEYFDTIKIMRFIHEHFCMLCHGDINSL